MQKFAPADVFSFVFFSLPLLPTDKVIAAFAHELMTVMLDNDS